MSSSRISPREFETCVEKALESVPVAFRKYLENVVVLVEEEPSRADYDETDTPDDTELFGVFRGLPYFDRVAATTHLPAQIAIFRGPILRSCATRADVIREIRDTVVHEVGHMLGLADEEMPY